MAKSTEIKALTILERYKKLILGQTDLEAEEFDEAIKQLKDLEHYAHFTCGLWATDRPDLLKDKRLFWQIDFWADEKQLCKNCDSTGWVCEDHENLPFEGMSDNGCKCGGAGKPCPKCNEAANIDKD